MAQAWKSYISRPKLRSNFSALKRACVQQWTREFKSRNFFAKKFRVHPKRHIPANAAYNRARSARNIFAKQEPEEGSGKTLNWGNLRFSRFGNLPLGATSKLEYVWNL